MMMMMMMRASGSPSWTRPGAASGDHWQYTPQRTSASPKTDAVSKYHTASVSDFERSQTRPGMENSVRVQRFVGVANVMTAWKFLWCLQLTQPWRMRLTAVRY